MNQVASDKAKILVIDDSEELLDVFKLIIKKPDWDVIVKASADDLVSFVQQNKIDLLILDVLLKDSNGRTVCKELKSNKLTDYFPVILMSASPEYLIDFRACDADGFIEKPFDINTVLNKINYFLNQHEIV
jgi:DNA-binding response OmpR family regulator